MHMRISTIAAMLAAMPVTGAATTAPAAAPAAPRDAMLVSPAWLARNLKDPNLVLLHVGSQEGYKTHIPGARLVSLDDIAVMTDGRHLEMPAPADLRARLARLGISNGSRIIVYYGQDWVSPATRVVFTLAAAGLGSRVSLLDGGMAAWQRAGNKLTDAIPAARAGKLSPLRMQPGVVDAAFVRAHAGKPGYALIDARAAVFYDGVQTGGGGNERHKTGHIPGARNLPFTELTGTDLVVKPGPALAAAFRNAGVKPGNTVIVYCHIGQQGTAIVWAARSLGYKALLYDGSFQDWSLRGLPAEARGKRS
jgi:thiosulfate/3-mercaptopyruvate sulfurtransferase